MTTVTAPHDPFAPPVRFPEGLLSRALGADEVEGLRTHFAGMGYAEAAEWARDRRGSSESDLRARYTVPEDPTTLGKPALIELAAMRGLTTSGTKDELSARITEHDAARAQDEGQDDAQQGEGEGQEGTATPSGTPAGEPAPSPAPGEEPGTTLLGTPAPGDLTTTAEAGASEEQVAASDATDASTPTTATRRR